MGVETSPDAPRSFTGVSDPLPSWYPRNQFPTHEELVNATIEAARALRLYMYDTDSPTAKRITITTEQCKKRRSGSSSHDWFNLESQLWAGLPPAVFTKDPEDADFFVVWDQEAELTRGGNLDSLYLRANLPSWLLYIRDSFPWYNRSGGRDHLIVYAVGNGPQRECNIQKTLSQFPAADAMMRAMTKVGYYGMHASSNITEWRPGVDVAMPMFSRQLAASEPPHAWYSNLQRPNHVFFSGSMWGNHRPCLGHQTAFTCSPMIRQHWVKPYMQHSTPVQASASARSCSRARCHLLYMRSTQLHLHAGLLGCLMLSIS